MIYDESNLKFPLWPADALAREIDEAKQAEYNRRRQLLIRRNKMKGATVEKQRANRWAFGVEQEVSPWDPAPKKKRKREVRRPPSFVPIYPPVCLADMPPEKQAEMHRLYGGPRGKKQG